jgi:hypothetical protein
LEFLRGSDGGERERKSGESDLDALHIVLLI